MPQYSQALSSTLAFQTSGVFFYCFCSKDRQDKTPTKSKVSSKGLSSEKETCCEHVSFSDEKPFLETLDFFEISHSSNQTLNFFTRFRTPSTQYSIFISLTGFLKDWVRTFFCSLTNRFHGEALCNWTKRLAICSYESQVTDLFFVHIQLLFFYRGLRQV